MVTWSELHTLADPILSRHPDYFEVDLSGCNLLIMFIIHSKYFPNSDWLKAHA